MIGRFGRGVYVGDRCCRKKNVSESLVVSYTHCFRKPRARPDIYLHNIILNIYTHEQYDLSIPIYLYLSNFSISQWHTHISLKRENILKYLTKGRGSAVVWWWWPEGWWRQGMIWINPIWKQKLVRWRFWVRGFLTAV